MNSFDYTVLLIGGIAGVAIGILVAAIYFMRHIRDLNSQKSELLVNNAALHARLETERAGLDDHFKALAQETLKSNSENFLNLAKEKLKAAQADGSHDLEKRTQAIEQMVKPVEKHLLQLNGAIE